jgi:spore coat protein U domain-containing protein, fimbrial subunit CupE1/2/3/6
MGKHLGAALVLTFALATAPASRAATVTATMPVSAVVVASCAVQADPLDFGNYSGLKLAQQTTLSVVCSRDTAYNVGLNAGTGTGATTTTRVMTGGTGTLDYQLFQNAAHTTNWGNTVGNDTVEGRGSGLEQTLTVYGQIPSGQFPPAGSYSDTITVTVTY